MSTQAELGKIISHEETEWVVVRIVNSTTFFETPEGESYLLEEAYAELRHQTTGLPGFKTFSQTKHPFVKEPGTKGLDTRIWKRF